MLLVLLSIQQSLLTGEWMPQIVTVDEEWETEHAMMEEMALLLNRKSFHLHPCFQPHFSSFRFPSYRT